MWPVIPTLIRKIQQIHSQAVPGDQIKLRANISAPSHSARRINHCSLSSQASTRIPSHAKWLRLAPQMWHSKILLEMKTSQHRGAPMKNRNRLQRTKLNCKRVSNNRSRVNMLTSYACYQTIPPLQLQTILWVRRKHCRFSRVQATWSDDLLSLHWPRLTTPSVPFHQQLQAKPLLPRERWL